MKRPGATSVAAVALVVAACGQASGGGARETVTEGTTSIEAGGAAADVPLCDDVPRLSAPPDWYRDEPVYVGNEMPVEKVRVWAEDQPGFEDVWVDRERNGWISLAFSEQAEERQADLTERFPGIGAVVVPVDWTMEQLEQLQGEVGEALAEEEVSWGISVTQGVVTIDFGVLTDERRAAVADRFGRRPVCVSGRDAADAPAAGSQPTEGDGWRLLADAQGEGEPYRTGIATDDHSYTALWEQIGLAAPPPEVAFEREVVIWFGAVFGSSCPELRLDDVIVDHERAVVHADVVLVDPPSACTDDANPHAYVVALGRDRLPSGPFQIQVRAGGPPRGAPEERTLVDVDLSVPGAVAGPDDLRRGDHGDLPPDAVSDGEFIETGFPRDYLMDVRCGVEWLGTLNRVTWRAQQPADAGEVPDAWRDGLREDGTVLVEVTIEPGSPPTAVATRNGRDVTYVPSSSTPPACS